MASERQIAANRANAAKSKGPTSPEGRQKYAQSSLRHGMLARTVVLNREPHRRLILLRDHFIPQSVVESTLGAMEKSSIAHEIRRQSAGPQLANSKNDHANHIAPVFRTLSDHGRSLNPMHPDQPRYHRQYHHSCAHLTPLREKTSKCHTNPIFYRSRSLESPTRVIGENPENPSKMINSPHFAAPATRRKSRWSAIPPSLFYRSPNWLRITRKRTYLGLLTLSLLLPCTAYPEQLPSRPFTTQDGLPLNRINDILADSHGLLWFASDVGLTRFDGYDFRTFTEEDGLPSTVVNALIESRDGTFWLATGRKLCHFQPHSSTGSSPAPKEFTAYDLAGTNEPTVLLEDHRDRIWCGTRLGLFVLNPRETNPQLKQIPLQPGGDPSISAIAEDASGVIWASFLQRLYRLPDGLPPEGFSSKRFGPQISSLLTDSHGRVWMGTWNGLHLLRSKPEADNIVEHTWTEQDGLSSRIIQSLVQSRDGQLWALTEHGLTGWDQTSGPPQFHKYEDTGGWLVHGLYGMAEDPQGALWVITESSGVVRLSRNGLTRFQKSDGLRSLLVRDVMEDRAHNIIAVTRIDSPDPVEQQLYRGPILHVLKGRRFIPVLPLYPRNLKTPGWGERQIVLQDHCGEWWIATSEGLLHYPAVPVEDLAHTNALDVYSQDHGLPSSDVFRLAEDPSGNIWIGTMGGGVSIRDRKTGQLSLLMHGNAPSELVADSHGGMWIGWWFASGLDRYKDGKITHFGQKDGMAPGSIRGIVFDHAGRMWVASSGGLSMADKPAGDSLHFTRYSPKEGLASRNLMSITEGANGKLYIGSDNGLDELDPLTDRIRHYGMQDGLPTEEVMTSFRDSHGVLWFGTHAGLVRFEPAVKPLPDQVQLRVTSLTAGGNKWPLSKLGERDVHGLTLDPDHNSFQIRFADLAFGSAGPLRFEYEIGSNHLGSKQAWSAPSTERSLYLAGLSAGTYRVRVRAVDPLGRVRSSPVVLGFTVRPQFWQTWWFDLILTLIAAGVVSVVLHYRVARIIAVQNIRSSISSDLHDDIGSGLSQIAIWSDIALRENAAGGTDSQMLEKIAESSRSLVDSISDIVWTINPRRDTLRELLQRIRRFASEACSSKDIGLEFNAPDGVGERGADSRLRHDVFLLAKEGINNAVKHSGCTKLHVEVKVSPRVLEMYINDNGKGISLPITDGNGLETMRRRARQLGGQVLWRDAPEKGTVVQITVPLKRSYSHE